MKFEFTIEITGEIEAPNEEYARMRLSGSEGEITDSLPIEVENPSYGNIYITEMDDDDADDNE